MISGIPGDHGRQEKKAAIQTERRADSRHKYETGAYWVEDRCDRHHDAGSEIRGPDETPAISNSDLAVIGEVDGEACNPPKAQDIEDSPDESQDTTPHSQDGDSPLITAAQSPLFIHADATR